jgi:hypothetical protein
MRAIASAARWSRSDSRTTGRSSRVRALSSLRTAIEQVRHRRDGIAWIVAPCVRDQLSGEVPFVDALLISITAGREV